MHSNGVMLVALLLYDTTVYLLAALACAKGQISKEPLLKSLHHVKLLKPYEVAARLLLSLLYSHAFRWYSVGTVPLG